MAIFFYLDNSVEGKTTTVELRSIYISPGFHQYISDNNIKLLTKELFEQGLGDFYSFQGNIFQNLGMIIKNTIFQSKGEAGSQDLLGRVKKMNGLEELPVKVHFENKVNDIKGYEIVFSIFIFEPLAQGGSIQKPGPDILAKDYPTELEDEKITITDFEEADPEVKDFLIVNYPNSLIKKENPQFEKKVCKVRAISSSDFTFPEFF